MKVTLEIDQSDLNRVMHGTPKEIKYYVHNHPKFALVNKAIHEMAQEELNSILKEADKFYYLKKKKKGGIFYFKD